jgi:hypothetical protein
MDTGEVGFTTFRIKDDFDTTARVVAAFCSEGKDADGNEAFRAQFAYCSPKEKNTNKNIGRYIAYSRLVSGSHRGGIPFGLPAGFKPRDFRDMLRGLIIQEAKRKRLRWLMKYEQSDLI